MRYVVSLFLLAGVLAACGASPFPYVLNKNGNATNLTVQGTFTGDGASLTNLNATSLATGTIPAARLPATALVGGQAGDGSGLTNLNGTQIGSGTIPLARLPAAVLTNGATGKTLDDLQLGPNGLVFTNPAASEDTYYLKFVGGKLSTTADISVSAITGSGNAAIDGSVTASSFVGNGAAITTISGANIQPGTIPIANLPQLLSADNSRLTCTKVGNDWLLAVLLSAAGTNGGYPYWIVASNALKVEVIGTNVFLSALVESTNVVPLVTNDAGVLVLITNIASAFSGQVTNDNLLAWSAIAPSEKQNALYYVPATNSEAGLLAANSYKPIAINTNLNATYLTSGTVPLARLPSAVVTNNASGLTLAGTFSGTISGDGTGLTNLAGAGTTNGTWQSPTIINPTNSGIVTIGHYKLWATPTGGLVQSNFTDAPYIRFTFNADGTVDDPFGLFGTTNLDPGLSITNPVLVSPTFSGTVTLTNSTLVSGAGSIAPAIYEWAGTNLVLAGFSAGTNGQYYLTVSNATAGGLPLRTWTNGVMVVQEWDVDGFNIAIFVSNSVTHDVSWTGDDITGGIPVWPSTADLGSGQTSAFSTNSRYEGHIIAGPLVVTGATTLGGSLSITGATTFSSAPLADASAMTNVVSYYGGHFKLPRWAKHAMTDLVTTTIATNSFTFTNGLASGLTYYAPDWAYSTRCYWVDMMIADLPVAYFSSNQMWCIIESVVRATNSSRFPDALNLSSAGLEYLDGNIDQTAFPQFVRQFVRNFGGLPPNGLSWLVAATNALNTIPLTNVAVVWNTNMGVSYYAADKFGRPAGPTLYGTIDRFVAYRDLAELFALAGDLNVASNCVKKCDAVRSAMTTNFWSESDGMFKDANNNAIAVAGSAWAVNYGLATPAQAQRIRREIAAHFSTWCPSIGGAYFNVGSGYPYAFNVPSICECLDGYRPDLCEQLIHDCVWNLNLYPVKGAEYFGSGGAPPYYLSAVMRNYAYILTKIEP